MIASTLPAVPASAANSTMRMSPVMRVRFTPSLLEMNPLKNIAIEVTIR